MLFGIESSTLRNAPRLLWGEKLHAISFPDPVSAPEYQTPPTLSQNIEIKQ
jgi:hypothetical protein